MSDKQFNVALVGLGFGAEFIPIYQRHPEREPARDLPAHQDQVGPDRRRLRHRAKRYTDFADVLRDPGGRCRPHQHADPGPRATIDRGAGGGQARGLHRPDGHHDRRVPADRRAHAAKTGLKYMMMETVVYAASSCLPRSSTTAATWARSSSWRHRTSRTWTGGPTTGRDCRRCTTRPTAWVRAWH